MDRRGLAGLPDSAWAALGAAATAAAQAAAVVLIARLGGAAELGRYALAAALTAPLLLLARMQFRSVVAAEGEAQAGLDTFFLTRLLASGTAVAAAAAGGALLFDTATAAVVLCLALERGAADLAELAWGFEQRRGNWAGIARSQALHSLALAAPLGAFLSAGLGLPVALTLAAATHLVIFLAVDAPRPRLSLARTVDFRSCLALARRCGWLAPAAALVSLTGHMPRFALDRWADLETVGSFAALVQLTLLGNLAVQALGQAALAPLARADIVRFRNQLARLTRQAAAVAAAGTVLAAACGGPLLALLYGPDFSRLAPQLAALAAASVFLHWAGVWGYALMALGERRLQVPIYLAAVAASAAVAAWTVPAWGLWGGIAAYAAGWAVAAAGCAWSIAAITKTPRHESSASEPRPSGSG